MDRRRLAARPDLAADHLAGHVKAERYASAQPMRVCVEIADLLAAPNAGAARETQALYGESVSIYEVHDGWAWGQLETDSYVGYLRVDALGPDLATPTHCVAAMRTFLYEAASIKSRVAQALPMGARVTCANQSGLFLEVNGGGFVYAAHLDQINSVERDFVAVAERFLNAPYLWGGKTWLGLDCSGLIQIALQRAGVSAPRDADMQENELGAALSPAVSLLQRGDLVFWKGHVGLLQDGETLLHANGYHMKVTSEPLREAVERIRRSGGGEPTQFRRLAESP